MRFIKIDPDRKMSHVSEPLRDAQLLRNTPRPTSAASHMIKQLSLTESAGK